MRYSQIWRKAKLSLDQDVLIRCFRKDRSDSPWDCGPILVYTSGRVCRGGRWRPETKGNGNASIGGADVFESSALKSVKLKLIILRDVWPPQFSDMPCCFLNLTLLFGLQLHGISWLPPTSLHTSFCHKDRCAGHEHWKCRHVCSVQIVAWCCIFAQAVVKRNVVQHNSPDLIAKEVQLAAAGLGFSDHQLLIQTAVKAATQQEAASGASPQKIGEVGKNLALAMAVSPPSGLNSSNKELVSLRSALFWAAKAAAKSTLIQQMKERHGPPSAAQEAVVQALQAVQATGHHLGSRQMAELVGQTVTSISLKQGGLVGRYGSLGSNMTTRPPLCKLCVFSGGMSRVARGRTMFEVETWVSPNVEMDSQWCLYIEMNIHITSYYYNR